MKYTNIDIDTLLKELDRLQKRSDKYQGLYKSTSNNNSNLSALNINLRNENKELKKTNRLHKRVNDELVNDIKVLEKSLETKDKTINSKNLEIYELKKQVENLTKENDKLKRIISKDVENSSVPSSVNVFKKKVANNRTKSNRSKGGQKGHKGHSLEYLEPTNIVEVNHEEKCPKCDTLLITIDEKKKQLVDAYVKLRVEEYNIKIGECPTCGYISKPNIPHNLVNNVTYGKSLKSMIVLLNAYGLVSINRTSKMINELTRGVIKIAESSICNIIKETSKKCEGEIEVIKEKLLSSHILHVDETPIRTEGKLSYVHVIANNDFTLLSGANTRGKKAVEEIGVLGKYSGTLVHDHYSMYYSYGMGHQECNAHILRYLKGFAEIEKGGWSQDMSELLRTILHDRKELIKQGVNSFSEEQKKSYINLYNSILIEAREYYLDSNKYNKDAINLYKRMEKYKDNHLLFMNDFSIPFENNQAERDVRMLKSKTKVSGYFNMLTGAQDFLNIRSVLQSCIKKKMNTLDAIMNLHDGVKVFT